jgi:RNA polymerase sigma-70 factor (ECF subfamily)
LGSVDCRMNAVEKTDEALMSLVCDGHESAFAELVRRYEDDIFRFCLHYVREVERAKEIAQETFVRVFVARGRFDPSRKFRPWILCIARNLCFNDLKRKTVVPMESLESYISSLRKNSAAILRSKTEGPDELMVAAERRQVLAQALDTLDDDAREIIVLRFFQRMAARDIAEIIGSSEGAVRTRVHRILKTLRERYEASKEDF